MSYYNNKTGRYESDGEFMSKRLREDSELMGGNYDTYTSVEREEMREREAARRRGYRE